MLHKIGYAGAERRRRLVTCRQGHPFTASNTYVRKDGRRMCRRCHADGEKRRWQERKRDAQARQFVCEAQG